MQAQAVRRPTRWVTHRGVRGYSFGNMRVRTVLVRSCVAYSFGRRPQVQEEDRARWQTRQARARAKTASKTAQPAEEAKGYAQATDDTRGGAQAKEAPRKERLVLRLGCLALTLPCPAQPRPCLRWPALPRPALPGAALRRRDSPSPPRTEARPMPDALAPEPKRTQEAVEEVPPATPLPALPAVVVQRSDGTFWRQFWVRLATERLVVSATRFRLLACAMQGLVSCFAAFCFRACRSGSFPAAATPAVHCAPRGADSRQRVAGKEGERTTTKTASARLPQDDAQRT